MTEKYLIWSEDHKMWWCPRCNGYTSILKEAGLYSREEAEEICKDANICMRNKPHELMFPYFDETENV